MAEVISWNKCLIQISIIMNLDEVLHHRRSVRVYDKEKPIDTEKGKHCLELAWLNSSDMQLWEFYHITEPELLAKIQGTALVESGFYR